MEVSSKTVVAPRERKSVGRVREVRTGLKHIKLVVPHMISGDCGAQSAFSDAGLEDWPVRRM